MGLRSWNPTFRNERERRGTRRQATPHRFFACTTRNPITCAITRERPTRKANNRSSSQRRPGKLAPIKAAERRHILAPDVSPGSAQQKGTESPRDDRNHTKTCRVPILLFASFAKREPALFCRSPERSRRGEVFDFPCRESKSRWTYARGIPPFATNAKDGAPGNLE